MIIRKKLKFENAHVVRSCTSERCKGTDQNGIGEGGMHGHSYTCEVFLSAKPKEGKLFDRAGMMVDFSLFGTTIKDFVDSHDHTYSMWKEEGEEFQNFIKKYSARHIIAPVSPSAEQMSLYFLFFIDKIVQATEFANGEADVFVHSVRVDETLTGYAIAEREDLKYIDYKVEDFIFSDAIKKDWKYKDMQEKLQGFDLTGEKQFFNDAPEQQLK